MEENDIDVEKLPQDQRQKDRLAAACTVLVSDDEDYEDQWEYEYSSTETETYYLTLDLSTPEVPPTHPPFDDTVRKKTRWLDPCIGRHRRQTPMPPANRTAKTYTLDGRISPDESEVRIKGSVGDADIAGLPTSDEIRKGPKSVQILDLESNTPIVAFDGNVYACSWAENIGTEMIFSPVDAEDTSKLPKLRTLRGNVDLLACSTSRLVARSLKLTPLQDTRPKVDKLRDRNKILIPVGHAASQQRKNQALFLEKLILAKEKLGEPDFVTVNAKPRFPPRKVRSMFEEKREQEKTLLQNKLNQVSASAEDKEVTLMNLEEMNREEMEWAGRGESFTKAGRCGGRPKKIPLGIGDGKITKSTLWSQRNIKGMNIS